MGMKQVTTAPLSTLLYDAEEGKYLIRLSIWIDPEDMDLESDVDDKVSTIAVSAQKGRTRLYGKIDRRAYKAYLTKDMPAAQGPVPAAEETKRAAFAGTYQAPIEGTLPPVATKRERMYR